MEIEVKVPSMGESVVEATFGAILKPEGSWVTADEEICELETDKVNQILYAPAAGTIKWHATLGEAVKIGQVVAHIDSSSAPLKPKEKPQEVKKEEKMAPEVEKAIPTSLKKENKEKASEKEPAKPAQKQQIEKPVEDSTVARESRKKMSRIRQVIAERLVEATHTTAMLTTFNEVDLSAVMALRTKHQEQFLKVHGVKLGYMPFFVAATVAALKAVPSLNAYIDGDEIVQRHYYDIGIAVGTDRGVIVPVIRDCDKLSFNQIESAKEGFAQKARKGSITVDDLKGAGFTITNGGIYGSLLSTPLLTPPQTGILGMHKIEKRPVVVDDQIVIRPMMYLALSYDHRLVDGKEAVTFLVHIKSILEDPFQLLLHLE